MPGTATRAAGTPGAPVASGSSGRRSRLLGAVTAQALQAFGGLVLSVAAARLSGAAGLAAFSLIYGAIVLAAAIASGLLGDSWTVLDRSDPAVRAALFCWAGIVLIGAGGAAVLLGWACGGMSAPAALATGAATSAFLVQELVRRTLMAEGRYWSLPLMDGLGIVVTVAGLLAGVAISGTASLGLLLGSLALGQLVSAGVGWCRLPVASRRRGPRCRPAMRNVWAFGSWRAAGQAVKPSVLTLMRTVVVAAVGAAAYGPLEAARVYTAPVLVLITGVGSFLLPQYVSSRRRPLAATIKIADRAVLFLVLGSAAVGALTVALLPIAGPLLTGDAFEVPVLAVAGWSSYAVTSAMLLPYAGLATVHGEQRRLLLLRSLELVSLTGVVAVVVLAPGHVELTPFALSVGPAVTALVVRKLLTGRAAAPAALSPLH
jgi:hypothetical protein